MQNGKHEIAVVLPLVDKGKTADPKWWPGTKSKVNTAGGLVLEIKLCLENTVDGKV